MVHIRECMRRWLPFVIMAASLGVSLAQDVASPDAADLDLDLVKLKSGPKGRQREAMRKVLLLVHLKQKETWLAESTGDEAVHLGGGDFLPPVFGFSGYGRMPRGIQVRFPAVCKAPEFL